MLNHQPPLRLLGLFAHPDDEVFCVGGTFAKLAARGAETMVVSFTRGEAGQIRDAAIATRRTLGSVRLAELDRSCAELSVDHVRCLDYGDGQMNAVDFDTLVAAAVEIIRDFRPDLVFTFDETGAYGHPDHIAISHVTAKACQLAGNPLAYPKISTAFAPQHLYHAIFPQNDRLLLKLLVEWLSSLDTRFRGTDEFTHALLLFADESNMLGYASDHLEIKWYPRGFYVIEQGEPAISLYLILSGSIDIYIEDDDGKVSYIETHGTGTFIGESGIAYGAPRNAHCVAAENTTCLVFSPGEPTSFAGRGEGAQFATDTGAAAEVEAADMSLISIDVQAFINHKVRALSQHRSQYPITPDLFPSSILEEVMGHEHFKLVWSSEAADFDHALVHVDSSSG